MVKIFAGVGVLKEILANQGLSSCYMFILKTHSSLVKKKQEECSHEIDENDARSIILLLQQRTGLAN